MRVLMITNEIPYPPITGGRVRAYNLLQRIACTHQVWLAALLDSPEDAEGVPAMRRICRGVETARRRRHSPLVHLPGLLRYALAGRPLELKFQHSPELLGKIRRLASAVGFDLVQIEPSSMAPYQEALPRDGRCKRVLVFYDVIFDQYLRIARSQSKISSAMRARLHSLMMRRWEPRYAERFDRCITVSDDDRRLLSEANPRLRIDVVPNGVDTRAYQPLPRENGPATLLFLGKMSYPPCADAALYFCREILPRVKDMVGTVEVWIVGSDPPPEVARLDGSDIHVTGRVDSVVPYYRRSTVSVVPLLAGGGTRLKILEAMALGRPVVSTTIGCQGLDVADGEHLLVADTPEQFAERTVQLLRDRTLYERIVASARQLVVSRYDWDAVSSRLMQVYAEMAGAT